MRFRDASRRPPRSIGISARSIWRTWRWRRRGDEAAWGHFVREYRPALYRAADALDRSGGARDLADALYAELFGLTSDGRPRQSLLQYFHGRSSLTTWLRAVLAQRHVDRRRVDRRTSDWPDDESPAAIQAPARDVDPERERHVAAMRGALGEAVSRLAVRDRLRLGCYYAQQLTLAETGRILGEHEATASRQLARTRREIRAHVERHLREQSGFSSGQAARCIASLADDAGPLDLGQLLGGDRKKTPLDRSPGEKAP